MAGAGRAEWQPVCRLAQLECGRGATALVHGQAVAVFRTGETTVHALADHDPFDPHGRLARGIVGSAGDVPFVALPVHRHRFDLRTGACLEDQQVRVAVYAVRVAAGLVLVGGRLTVG